MSNSQVLVSDDKESESGKELIEGLPPWMPTDDKTGNFKLLDVVGRAIDRTDGDIQDVDRASTVQDAETVAQLQELAKLVSLPPKSSEPKEKYRARIIAEFQKNTNEATPSEVINNSATLLDVDPSQIEYRKENENGVITLTVPKSALQDLSLTDFEFVSIMSDSVAAGFRIGISPGGTFTYLGTSDYSGPYDSGNGGYDASQLNSDASFGHDGLDSNGDPKDNGGTYSGIITN